MARSATWAVLAAVGLALAGCGPAKELPEDIPPPEEVGEKKIDVPVASEKAAQEYVEKAVKSFTGGKPELVAQGRQSRVVLKGVMTLPLDGQKSPYQTTRTVTAVWPDRVAVTNELLSGVQRMNIGAWLNRTDFTALSDGQEPPIPNRAEVVRNHTADVTGQFWMGLGLPLVEPKAVVFDLRALNILMSESAQPLPVKQLKLALPDRPVYQLTFVAQTDLLARVEYATVESGTRRRKQWSVIDNKAAPNGVWLPQKIELRHDGQVVEQWDVDKWEFPAKIDDAEFSPPQPKK